MDAAIELARQPADGLLVADVGGAQPAGGQSAEMPARLDEHDALAHPRGLHGGDDAAGRAAVDDDVMDRLRRGGRGGKTREREEDKRAFHGVGPFDKAGFYRGVSSYSTTGALSR